MKDNESMEKIRSDTIATAKKTPKQNVSRASSSSVLDVEDLIGHTQHSDIVTIEERLRKLQEEYSIASTELSKTRKEYDELLRKCEAIRLLLVSYYNLEENAEHLHVPEKGTPYWYVRATFGRSHFDVCQCDWIGGLSDKFRYCRGNFFLEERTANLVCNSCNALMARL